MRHQFRWASTSERSNDMTLWGISSGELVPLNAQMTWCYEASVQVSYIPVNTQMTWRYEANKTKVIRQPPFLCLTAQKKVVPVSCFCPSLFLCSCLSLFFYSFVSPAVSAVAMFSTHWRNQMNPLTTAASMNMLTREWVPLILVLSCLIPKQLQVTGFQICSYHFKCDIKGSFIFPWSQRLVAGWRCKCLGPLESERPWEQMLSCTSFI